MLIVRVMGGLGNQLFQYAFYELLLQMGKEACLDISHYGNQGEIKDKRPLDLLLFRNLEYTACSEKEKLKYLDERNTFWDKVRHKLWGSYNRALIEDKQYMPEIFQLEEGYLQGYWNSERYSGRIERLLQEKLQFPPVTDPRNAELVHKMANEESVSIHVRLGDYLLEENQKLFGGICTEEYYQAAMEEVKKQCTNPVFYIFCEDSTYIRTKVSDDNIRIVDWNKGRDSIFDMYLMSLCKGNICANSTFSIWAAKLNKRNDRIRIRPEVLDNQVEQGREEAEALWQNGWILISRTGRIPDWD